KAERRLAVYFPSAVGTICATIFPSPCQSPMSGSLWVGIKFGGCSVFRPPLFGDGCALALKMKIAAIEMVAMIFVFIKLIRQRLVFGFRQEREHANSQEQHEAPPHSGRAKAFDIAAETFGDAADRKRRGRGDEPPKVVAKTGAGAAQAGREKFRQIN